ncbi:DUF488 domain-containing protein [Leifsonia sp. 22587]|uniref:DUF488 domain-containing protein n=1 Tax=Leifsonia sp. 22587 TaxID=3453946 RepID=UPI003F843022
MITVKRVYDPPSPDDGFRILIDRLWPRGLTKERAAVDVWLKDVAPSTELRRWFHRDPSPSGEAEVFDEFRARYEQELATNPAVDELRELLAAHPRVTFLVGVRDLELNHGKVLEDFLEHHP